MLDYVSIDFETYLISNESPSPKPVCLSYYNGTDKGIYVGKDIEWFLHKILNSNIFIIAHNMRFEALVIYEHFPHLRDKLINKLQRDHLICTKVTESLINNTRKKAHMQVNLAACVDFYFQKDITDSKKNPDAWRLRYHELEGVPLRDWPQEAIDYSISDSVWAYKIYMQQLKHTTIDARLSVKADFYLNLMANKGLLVDKTRVQTLKTEILNKIIPNYMALEKLGITGYQSNHIGKKSGKLKPAKFTKKMNVLREYVTANVKDVDKTAKGSVATASESLEKYVLAESTPDEVKANLNKYLDIIKYEKILTSFVSRLETADPVIRTNYNPCVSSGRTSSSGSDIYPSVNIQQMPRAVEDVTWDVRNCFVPREGNVICSIDYSGLELAATAHQLNMLGLRHDMADTINSKDVPVDMHSMLGYRIMNMKEKTNVTYEEFVANKKKEPYKAYRQLAKPINLGFPGGIGYDTMRTLLARDGIYPRLQTLETAQYENNLQWKVRELRAQGYPVRVKRTGFAEYQLVYDELVALKAEMFALYPDLQEFLTEGHKEFLTGQMMHKKNEFGEWEEEPAYQFKTHGFEHDWCMYTQFCNGYLMQSPSAIGAKKAMCAIIEHYRSSDDMIPLAFIHDEIVFEIKQNNKMYAIIEHVSSLMITEMQSVLTSVRIAVEAEVFPYWKKSGSDWSKVYFKNPGDDTIYHV